MCIREGDETGQRRLPTVITDEKSSLGRDLDIGESKISFWVKYTFQPSTRAEVRFSTFNYETGQKHPSTIKTGQIWSLADFKSGFLFSGGAEILYYFFEHLNVLK